MGNASRYIWVRKIASAAHGEVVLVRDTKTDSLVAVKKMSRQRMGSVAALEAVESCLVNHSNLRHPHIIQVKEVFLSRGNLNIVLDYADSGSLLSYIRDKGPLPESEARWFFQQVIFVLGYIHMKGLAHSDVCLENLLLCWPAGSHYPLVKLGGLSRVIRAPGDSSCPELSGQVATTPHPWGPAPLAPEALVGCTQGCGGSRSCPQGDALPHDPRAADVWEAGAALYEMLAGRCPFDCADSRRKFKDPGVPAELKGGECQPPGSLLGVSAGCAALLSRLLEPDASKRIKTEQIMQDPWFQSELPSDVLTANRRWLAAPRRCRQSEEQLRLLVRVGASGMGRQPRVDGWQQGRSGMKVAGRGSCKASVGASNTASTGGCCDLGLKDVWEYQTAEDQQRGALRMRRSGSALPTVMEADMGEEQEQEEGTWVP